jgi:hypothetical protein
MRARALEEEGARKTDLPACLPTWRGEEGKGDKREGWIFTRVQGTCRQVNKPVSQPSAKVF